MSYQNCFQPYLFIHLYNTAFGMDSSMTDLLKGVAFVDAFGAEVSLSKVTSNDLIAVSEQFAVCSSWVVGGGVCV